MRSLYLPLSLRFDRSSTFMRNWFIRGWRRRALCFVLIFGLLTVPDAGYAVSAATVLIVQAVKESVAPVPVAVDWFNRLLGLLTKPHQETTADRSSRVTSINILPARMVIYTGQQISFSAVGSGAAGQTVQGAQFSWSTSDADKLRIDDSGLATPSQPGLVWVTAATPNTTARVPVLVRPGPRPLQTDIEWQLDQDQLRPDGTIIPGNPTGSLFDSLVERLMPTAHAQTGGGDNGDFLYDELYTEPRNLVGSPRGIATSSGYRRNSA